MHLDVQALRDFYYRSALGRAAQRIVRDEVLRGWSPADVHGQTVVGYGFAVPLLRPYLKEARRVTALMPAAQGVMPWPQGMPNISVLSEETLWPLETGHVDRLVVMHGLETTQRATDLLDESYRVLGPGGRALFIVPNRSGLWAQADWTPFGYGRPYSMGQLEAELKRHDFLPERTVSLLYQPPSARRFWMKTGPIWEKLGRWIPITAGGVLMVEAAKRHPPTRAGLTERRAVANPLGVLAPKPGKVAPTA
ncbi:methyltransferase domain-containing protein [Sagittula salina]|uniref:Methyltransferase type 11 domain-containing protein n=1 Tax=Sagittula salina TaxID=2820268 RepID=A0A940S345_9RHOB|nr:methyltransferase domain-containing protein [Sagittula salina]MBP0482659.1 hypothetical protein [Sagittula salina]